VNPQDQERSGGQSVYAYLLAHAHELEQANAECSSGACTTELERVLLVVDAAGTSAHAFGGVDLEARLRERQRPDGDFTHQVGGQGAVNDTEFALMALAPQPDAADAVHRAAEWLIAEQNADGSWPSACPRSACPGAAGEVDATAAAVEALEAAHPEGELGEATASAVAGALSWLRKAQESVIEPGDPGGLPESSEEAEANVASTAWVAQALWSAGVSPATWTFDGGSPIAYLVSMQQPDGHIRYSRSSDENPVWMTAYVLPAFNGVALPMVDVPRSVPQASSTAPQAGPGGLVGGGGSSGVLAGGGGAGAPDFSRPRAGGRGHAARTRHAGRGSASIPVAGAAAAAPAPGSAPAPRRPTHAGVERRLTSAEKATGGIARREPGIVRGLLLASREPLPLAPVGLRGAGAGGSSSSWLAIALGFGALGLAVLGAGLERRRPQARVLEMLASAGSAAGTGEVTP
jgi:hypothetical protein